MNYLFKAEFADGTIYEQPESDLNSGVKSCFSVVLERINEVKKFSLIGEEQVWSVDLTDGHFEHNGVPFQVNTEITPKVLTDYRLIYFQRKGVQMTEEIVLDDNLQAQTVGRRLGTPYIKSFRFGYQANDVDGANHQQIIEIH